MKLIRHTLLGCVAAGVTLLAFSSSVRADLALYEGFDYTAGSNALNGKNGGVGFTAAWGNQNADVVAGSFAYTDTNGMQLATSGNRAFMDATGTDPNVAGTSISPIRTIAGLTGGTIYVSFLAQQTAGDARDISVSLFAANAGSFGTSERITIGHGNGFTTWGAYALADAANGAHSAAASNNVTLLVARIDENASGLNERVRLYVNPTLGIEPIAADVDFDTQNFIDSIGDITRLRMRAGGSDPTKVPPLAASQFQADELRIGGAFADVTPAVPEPASSVLALAGAALLAIRRRRR